jgi:hypothetical protein
VEKNRIRRFMIDYTTQEKEKNMEGVVPVK